jgi:hypothetical protein
MKLPFNFFRLNGSETFPKSWLNWQAFAPQLEILNGNITASSSASGDRESYGSGIGSGRGHTSGNSTVVNLSILNGNITASGSNGGAGIGAGSAAANGSSSIGTLALIGGRIAADGGLAGIGSGGEGGDVGLLTFAGSGLFVRCAADGPKIPINASSIRFSNSSVIFETPGDRLFGVSPTQIGRLDLAILYGAATSEWNESVLGLNSTLLQIGNLSSPLSGDWTLRVSSVSGASGEHSFAIRSSGVRSLIVTVGFRGNCSVSASNATVSGFFETPEGVSTFGIESDRLFIPEGSFVFAPRPTPTAVFTRSLLFPFHGRRMMIIQFGWFLLWARI